MQTISEYAEVCQGLIRHLHTDLTNSEFKVLLFIVERTLRYGKAVESIPYRHFLQGIITRTYDVLVHPVSVTRQSLSTALKSLEAKGYIRRRGGKDVREANIITIVVTKIREAIMSARTMFLERATAEKVTKGEVKKEHHEWSKKSTTNKYKKKDKDYEVNTSSINAGAGEDTSIRSIINNTISSTQDRMQKVAAMADRPTDKNVRAVWNSSVIGSYPTHTVPQMPNTSAGRLRNNMVNVHFGDQTWKTVMQWAISNWSHIKQNNFSWMIKSPMPDVPNFVFYSNHVRRFVEAYFSSKGKQDFAQSFNEGSTRTSAKERLRIAALEERNHELEMRIKHQQKINNDAIQELLEKRTRECQSRRQDRVQRRASRSREDRDMLIASDIPEYEDR